MMRIVLAILLCSLGSQTNANFPQRAADLGLHHRVNMKADSRLLLNPFNIFGNDICEYRGTLGTCYGEVECLALAGNYGNFCPGLQGLCCLFYRTCGQRTSQEVAYFRNVQYPLDDRVPTSCSFQIVKRSDEYCGLRVTMEQAELPDLLNGFCEYAYYHVTGVHNNNIKPKCGTMTGKEYTYDITNVEEIHLHFNSTESVSVSWNLKVTQVKCSQWETEDYEDEHDQGSSGGGGGSGGGTGGGSGGDAGGDAENVGTGEFGGAVFPPPAITHPPGTVGPPAPPTKRPPTTESPSFSTSSPVGGSGSSYSKCGVRGPPFGQGSRGAGGRRMQPEGPLGPGMLEVMARRRKTPNRRPEFVNQRVPSKVNQGPQTRPADLEDVVGTVATGGVVTSLDWDVPTLNDTLFAHYSGEPALIPVRVTYGSVAGTREFPWAIAMTINGKFHCGASLLSNTHVLTAAHCVVSYKYSPSKINLSLGDWDLSTTNDGHNVRATASKVTVHPSYNRATLQNDLAVLQLNQRIEFTERVRPICLPDSDIGIEGEQAIVMGWGRNEDSKLQAQLHHLRATVVSNLLCDQRWNTNGAARGFIVQSMMCMDSQGGDSCNGDSGGPSVYEYPVGSNNYIQVGIVSFGSGSCTDANLPGVYTRVSHFRNWIRQQMN